MATNEMLVQAKRELEDATKKLSEAMRLEQDCRFRVERLRSQKFIADNGIRKADVQLSNGEGMPYFLTVTGFAKWISHHPPMKRWAEWNGAIYHTTDLLSGRRLDMPGRIEDVPE